MPYQHGPKGGEGGRGGSGTQNFVYRKWPHQIFPTVNFVFSRDGPFGLGGGGGKGEVTPPPPMVYGHANTFLPTPLACTVLRPHSCPRAWTYWCAIGGSACVALAKVPARNLGAIGKHSPEIASVRVKDGGSAPHRTQTRGRLDGRACAARGPRHLFSAGLSRALPRRSCERRRCDTRVAAVAMRESQCARGNCGNVDGVGGLSVAGVGGSDTVLLLDHPPKRGELLGPPKSYRDRAPGPGGDLDPKFEILNSKNENGIFGSSASRGFRKVTGIGISRSRISQLAAEVGENGGNEKMVGRWWKNGGNGGKWRKMGGGGLEGNGGKWSGMGECEKVPKMHSGK